MAHSFTLHRNNYLIYFSILFVVISSCKQDINKEEIKNEIIQSEKAFQDLVNAQGPATAFYEFAADSAVIKRENDTLIIGKNAIQNYYRSDSKNVRATWKPDFINVSNDGTLAYTYGKYEWAIKDSTGKESVFHGVFHTVWKRMTDKKWKYVWD